MYELKLLEEGIPPHLMGFSFLNTALVHYVPTDPLLSLYKLIAHQYDTSPGSVERAIRTALTHIKADKANGEWIAEKQILWNKEFDARIPTGWRCPYCRTVYSPTITCCKCEVSKTENDEISE